MLQFRSISWLMVFAVLTPLAGCGVTFNVSNNYSAAVDVSVRDPMTLDETFVISINSGGAGSAVVTPKNNADFDVLVRSGGNLLTDGTQTHLSVDPGTQEVGIEVSPAGTATVSVNPK